MTLMGNTMNDHNPIQKSTKDNFTTLVMLSGGIDSTAALWHVLNNPESYGNIHVHHINIQNNEGRWRVESAAVNAIYEYLRSHLSTTFSTSESTINTPSFQNNFLYDAEIIGFITGYMTSRDSSIKKVIIGATGTDWDRQDNISKTVERSKSMHNAFYADSIDHSSSVKEFPLRDMTKQEVYDSLPSDLALLTWSCRQPRIGNGRFIECGICKTCSDLQKLRRHNVKNKKVVDNGR